MICSSRRNVKNFIEEPSIIEPYPLELIPVKKAIDPGQTARDPTYEISTVA